MTDAHASLIGPAGLDHVGITVLDLEEATRFFVEVLGFAKGPLLGPIQTEDDWLARNLDVHPRSVLSMQILSCGGSKIELFGFSSPRQNPSHPRRDDVGGVSVGLHVDDIHGAIAALRANGVELLGERKDGTEGPMAGMSWIYARAPWGLMIFLAGKTASDTAS